MKCLRQLTGTGASKNKSLSFASDQHRLFVWGLWLRLQGNDLLNGSTLNDERPPGRKFNEKNNTQPESQTECHCGQATFYCFLQGTETTTSVWK